MKAEIQTKADFTIKVTLTLNEAKMFAAIGAFSPNDFIDHYHKMSPMLAKELNPQALGELFSRMRDVQGEINRIQKALQQYVKTEA